jgi:hypothetical protein
MSFRLLDRARFATCNLRRGVKFANCYIHKKAAFDHISLTVQYERKQNRVTLTPQSRFRLSKPSLDPKLLKRDPKVSGIATRFNSCRGTERGGAAEVLVASHSKRRRGGKRETWAGPPVRVFAYRQQT